jgi:hypothetical protein
MQSWYLQIVTVLSSFLICTDYRCLKFVFNVIRNPTPVSEGPHQHKGAAAALLCGTGDPDLHISKGDSDVRFSVI